MNKQAQIQQVFTFILIGVVIVVTLFFAIRMIGVITSSGCDAQITRFSDRLDELTNAYNSRGTLQITNMPTPCRAQAICYFPTTNTNTNNLPENIAPGLALQLNSSASLTGNNIPNVFLVVDGALEELGSFDKITTDQNTIVCTQQRGGQFPLRFAGDGRQVMMSTSTQ